MYCAARSIRRTAKDVFSVRDAANRQWPDLFDQEYTRLTGLPQERQPLQRDLVP